MRSITGTRVRSLPISIEKLLGRESLLCLQHFTGTLDNWDPAVTDPLGDGREVILFDSAGVGRSTGKVPTTVAGMAAHALQFLDGLCVTSCDVLGFSLGEWSRRRWHWTAPRASTG